MTPAAAFDRIARVYDSQWTETPAGRAQREAVWRECDTLFAAGSRMIDVGCGTGADARHFAGRGVEVLGVDCSAAMVARCVEISARATFRVLRAEDVADTNGMFDGAVSNFGALNCVKDLAAVGRGLAQVVRPGGAVAICLIGRCCAWETVYYAARGRFAKAWRRWRGTASSSMGITVRYPTVAEAVAAFEGFELLRWTGIGLFVPPSYVRVPDWLVRMFARVDGVLAGVWGLRALTDHRLLVLVRK